MVVCPRCGQKVDEKVMQACPLCNTPLPAANVEAQPGALPTGGYASGGQQPASPLLSPGSRVSLTGEVYEANPQQGAAPGYAGGGAQNSPGGALPPRAGGPSAASPNRREAAAPARSGSGGAVIAVILVLLLLGGGFGGYWFWTHRTNPKEQAEKFIVAFKAQDYKAMYEGYADHSQTETQFEENFTKTYSIFVNALKTLDYKAGAPTIKDDTASVPVAVSGSVPLGFGGQSFPVNTTVNLQMKNEGGIWKVSELPGLSAFAGQGGGGMRMPGKP